MARRFLYGLPPDVQPGQRADRGAYGLQDESSSAVPAPAPPTRNPALNDVFNLLAEGASAPAATGVPRAPRLKMPEPLRMLPRGTGKPSPLADLLAEANNRGLGKFAGKTKESADEKGPSYRMKGDAAASLELIAAEEKRVERTRELIKLEKARVEGMEASAKAIRDSQKETREAGAGIRTIGSVLAGVLRGDVVGVLQSLSGVASQAAERKAARLEEATRTGYRDLGHNKGVLKAARGAVEAGRQTETAGDTAQDVAAAMNAARTGGTVPASTAAPTPSPSLTGKATAGSRTPARTLPASPGLAASAGKAAPVLAGVEGLAAALGPLAAVAGAVSQVTAAMIQLGKAASPVAAEKLDMALEDMQATMGRVFVPVVELATDGIRLMGDALASILPSTEEMREAMAPFKDMFADLRDAFASVAPALKELIKFAVQVQSVVWKLTAVFATWPIQLGKLFGLFSGKEPLKSSVGAAARPASFSSIDEYSRKLYLSALSSGNATGGGAPEKGPVETLIEQAIEQLKIIAGAVTKAKDVKEAITSAAGTAGDVAAWLSPPVAIARGLRRVLDGTGGAG